MVVAIEATTVLFRDPARDGEPEARPASARRHERLEDALAIRGRDSGPVVPHGDQVALDADLVTRFQNFWPIVAPRRKNRGDIRMPFHALATDRVLIRQPETQ